MLAGGASAQPLKPRHGPLWAPAPKPYTPAQPYAPYQPPPTSSHARPPAFPTFPSAPEPPTMPQPAPFKPYKPKSVYSDGLGDLKPAKPPGYIDLR